MIAAESTSTGANDATAALSSRDRHQAIAFFYNRRSVSGTICCPDHLNSPARTPLNITAPARPRVLLADDYLPFLETVSGLLADAFDIVALAGGGHQALDLARRLRPAVIVLDIAMPDLDGFQTLKQLRRDDPETRVVFLTMHRDDELVAAAIKEGAHGYVLKSRAHLDLISAIEHALAGRLFVPSLTSLTTVPGSRHAVHVHANDSRFLDDVSQFVAATLRSGEQIVMVVSEATRIGVDQRLQARQMNLAMLSERGQYVAEDSALALSQVMIDARPDRRRLAQIINGLDHLRLAFQKRPNGRLTILGDMAVALCRNGNFEAALEIERIWNELTHALPFFTVCSYPIDCFEPSEGRTRLCNVCDEHSAVTS
jgi:DNA-binding NarL/FixJ family response regulator